MDLANLDRYTQELDDFELLGFGLMQSVQLQATNKQLIFKWGLASFFIFIGTPDGTPNGKAQNAQ